MERVLHLVGVAMCGVGVALEVGTVLRGEGVALEIYYRFLIMNPVDPQQVGMEIGSVPRGRDV